MGVDFSHGEASWSYGGFNRFREALAAHEGIDLNRMHGFKPFYAGDDWAGIPWDGVTTALRPLLDHSDCDGQLTPEECRQVAPRLREVIDAVWPDDVVGVDGYNRRAGLALAQGMDDAAAAGVPLEFQ